MIMVPEAGPPDETLCGDVNLAATKIVAAGKTVAICAGATVKAASNVSITVKGTLLLQGTAAMPVKLVGAASGAGSWTGIVIQNGGYVISTSTEIHDATIAVSTEVGSKYWFDHILVDNSSALLALKSSGSFSHATMHSLGGAQSEFPVYIASASPSFTDSLFDNGGASDIITVAGTASAASFDYLEVAEAHCAFHFNAGTGCSITNSYIHDTSYGLMVKGSKASMIENNNFQNSDANLGDCGSSGTVVANGNYFQGSAFDESCVGAGEHRGPAGPVVGRGAAALARAFASAHLRTLGRGGEGVLQARSRSRRCASGEASARATIFPRLRWPGRA